MMRLANKIKGLGLLELLLALSIIAVLLLVSVRYYTSANTAQEASTLVNNFSTIKSAVGNYFADFPGSTTVPAINDLVSNGYLPGSFVVKNKVAYNQWGGVITVSSSAPSGAPKGLVVSAGNYVVMETNVPGTVCEMALGQLQASINSSLGESVKVSSSGTDESGAPKEVEECGSTVASMAVVYVK